MITYSRFSAIFIVVINDVSSSEWRRGHVITKKTEETITSVFNKG